MTTICKNWKSVKWYDGIVWNLAIITEILLGECMLNFVQYEACLHLSVQNVWGAHFFSGHTVYILHKYAEFVCSCAILYSVSILRQTARCRPWWLTREGWATLQAHIVLVVIRSSLYWTLAQVAPVVRVRTPYDSVVSDSHPTTASLSHHHTHKFDAYVFRVFSDIYIVFRKKHPILFSCITLRKSNQLEWKFQTK